MLKNGIKKRITICLLSLFILLTICFIPTNKKYEEKTSYVNNTNNVYLLNNNQLLIKTSFLSHADEKIAKAKEIITALTKGSNITNYLEKNLTQIIPENTKLLDIKEENDILKLNFSKELLNITADLEEKLIESLVYSLTESNDFNKIMLFVDGELLFKLPNSQQILPNILTRDYGINKIYEITTLKQVQKINLYYFVNLNNNYNVVPVTLFTNDNQNKVEIIIKNLQSSLAYQTDLVSFLSNNTKLLDYEIEENKIKLNFSTALLDNFYSDSLLEEVKYSISNSIKDNLGITDVSYFVNGVPI